MVTKSIIIRCWIMAFVATCASCTSISEQSIHVARDQKGRGVILCVKSSVLSRFDPDGGSRSYNKTINIQIFGVGSNMAYRNKPGTIYKYGKDFIVDVDSCNAGYLWLSDDRKKIGIALFDVDPPLGLSASEFNKVFEVPENEEAIFTQLIGGTQTTSIKAIDE